MRLEPDELSDGPDRQYPGSRLTPGNGFGTNPGALRMFFYVPADLEPGAPLLVNLHGCTQTARGYDHGVGWSTMAERHGFALLAPEQSRMNNPNGCFNWFQPEDTVRGRGEVESIHQMIEHLLDEHALDRSRVFITGLSAGGAMAAAMLAAYPELFAGGAIIAGLPAGAANSVTEALGAMRRTPLLPQRSWGNAVRDASPHQGPWPRISLWHGDADAVVTFSNMDASVAQWLDVQGLSGAPREVHEDGFIHRSWIDRANRPVVEAYTVRGLGHGTPIRPADDGVGEAGPFILNAAVSSTARIAQFFGLSETAGSRRKVRDVIADVLAVFVPPDEPVEEIAAGAVAEELAEVEDATPATAQAPLEHPWSRYQKSGDRQAGRLHRIITSALKAAGLMKDG